MVRRALEGLERRVEGYSRFKRYIMNYIPHTGDWWDRFEYLMHMKLLNIDTPQEFIRNQLNEWVLEHLKKAPWKEINKQNV